MEALVRILVGILLLVLLIKLALLRRFAAAPAHSPVDPWDDGLLPTQQEDVQALVSAVTTSKLEDPARVVKFEGRWGEGKSFLLRRFPDALRAHAAENDIESPAVVMIDVWKHQAEPDLHLAIFEEVLRNRHYLRGFGWLAYPWTVFAGRHLSGALMTLSLKLQSAAVDFPVKLPALPWQRPLERLVRRQQKRRRRTVIVLDEIDRAAPVMAQTAITLALRSLDLPGSVVVLSYVEPIMRYKAFNPLVPNALADVASSMEAILFEEAFDRPEPSLTAPADGSVYAWWASWCLPNLGPTNPAGDVPTGAPTGGAPAGPAPPADKRACLEELDKRLRRGFEGADRPTRLKLQARFDERYLGRPGVRVRPLAIRSVADMAYTFATLRPLAERVGGPDSPEARAVVADELERWAAQPGGGARVTPSVRALEGEIGSMLSSVASEMDQVQGSPSVLTATLVAAAQSVHNRYS